MDDLDRYAVRRFLGVGASVKAIAKELDVSEAEILEEIRQEKAVKNSSPFGVDTKAETMWRKEWDYWRKVVRKALNAPN